MYMRRPGMSGPTALDQYMPQGNQISIPRDPTGMNYRRPKLGITDVPNQLQDMVAAGRFPPMQGGYPTGGPLQIPREQYEQMNPQVSIPSGEMGGMQPMGPTPSTGIAVPGESPMSGRVLGPKDRKFYDDIRQMIQSGRSVGPKRMNRFEQMEDRRMAAGKRPMKQNMIGNPMPRRGRM